MYTIEERIEVLKDMILMIESQYENVQNLKKQAMRASNTDMVDLYRIKMQLNYARIIGLNSELTNLEYYI